MANIYISSTFKDLEDSRRQVLATLSRMHHDDVAMENYGAEDMRPLDRCLADVAACDLYVVIVAWRYGFIPAGRSQSITELEYRQAVESGKPRLVFLLSEDAWWPQSRVEREGNAYDRVIAFRDELREGRMAAEFMNETDLARRVGEAIYNWERSEGIDPAGGGADWESYRRAMFDTHRWVRLAVIAGAKQDRRFAEIPLTEVFVTQPTQAGPPQYDVPDEPSQRDPRFDSAEAADLASDGGQSDEETEPPLEVPAELGSSPTEPSLEVLGRERQQVFLGAPGSGKSTLLLDVALLLCDTARDPATLPVGLRGAPIPFLIELRQYVLDQATSFVDYLATSITRQYGVEIDAESIQTVLAANDRALVMFDGLDEVFDSATQSLVIDEFRAFARRYHGAQLVVTSRIAGYRALELERDGFRHYTLLGFGMPEIREFVPKWYTYYTWQGDLRDAGGLTRRISESPRLLELARNPLLLTMMAVIYKHQDLPEKRWQLYDRCTEVLLDDWDIKRKKIHRNLLLPLGFTMLGDQKAELLQRVSMYMLEHRRAGSELNAITREPLLKILASYLQEQYGKASGEARAVASEILDHLRERTYIVAEIGDQRFGFVHRTFMEFFAAQYCTAEFNRREADYDWLTRELFGKRWRQDEWREVLLLLVGMLKDQGSPVKKVIDHLRHEQVQGLPIQLGFAARCLAEATTSDDPWSRPLLAELTSAVCSVARQPNDLASRSFLEDALGSFAVLASTVSLAQKARRSIDALGKDQNLRSRMVSFQLQLALRSKEERQAFAIGALDDPEEAVRRGAIAALEREWPGRQEPLAAMLNVLRRDRLSRVRSAALQALDRSWPPDDEILQVLDSRAGVETAYTFIIEVMRYLARWWAGDGRALDVLFKFIKAGPMGAPASDALSGAPRVADRGAAVRAAAVEAILGGWRHTPDIQRLLQDRWRDASNQQGAVVALVALGKGWADDSEITAWIRTQLSEEADPNRRRTALSALLRARPADSDLQSWARQRAVDDKDSSVRREVISALSLEKGDTAGLRWFGERLVADSDAIVRLAAMDTWAAVQPRGDKRNSLLRDRAIRDQSGKVRSRALELLNKPRLDQRMQQFLFGRAVDEPDPFVRSRIVTQLAPRGRSTETFLRDRLHKDTSRWVRVSLLWNLVRMKLYRFNIESSSKRYHSLDQLDPARLMSEWVVPESSASKFQDVDEDSFLSNLRSFSTSSDLRISMDVEPGFPQDFEVDQTFGFLAEAAEEDRASMVRGYAILLITVLTLPHEWSRVLLERRLKEERDYQVRFIINYISR